MPKIMCCSEGCTLTAKWVPKMRVPATGVSLADHVPLSGIVNMPLCDAHFGEFDIKETLSGPGQGRLREIFCQMAKACHGPPPDFDRAFLDKIGLDSPEYGLFQRKSKQAEAHAFEQRQKLGPATKLN